MLWRDDPVCANTRKRAWSENNPYFAKGTAASGVGGPHVGLKMIWPMSIMMRALASDSDAEIRECLLWLKRSHAQTGFMHEAFDQDILLILRGSGSRGQTACLAN